MILCQVTGTVVATRKHERLRPAKLLIVHPVGLEGQTEGARDLLALDPKFDAGVGDYVLVAREGAVVAQLLGDAGAGATPANVVVVAVVDDWAVESA